MTVVVNGESVQWTWSSRLLDTRPLRAFIMKSICSFIIVSRICDGWMARVLSLWSAWGIATFWPFFVPSLSVGAFLVLLLSVKPRVFLAQLLF